MGPLSNEEIAKIVHANSPTGSYYSKGFQIGCTQLHVYDIRASLNFYCNVLGMRLLKKLDFPQGELSDYFLGYQENEGEGKGMNTNDYTVWAMTKPRTINLRHLWNRSSPYQVGDGLSTVSIIVPDVYGACAKIKMKGNITIFKEPENQPFQGLALLKDPDGYTIELYSEQAVRDHCCQ